MIQHITSRRQLFAGTALLGLAGVVASRAAFAAEIDTSDLHDITKGVPRIGKEERLGRLEAARKLMRDHKIDALLIEPGASMVYFSGVDWRRSERLTAVLITQKKVVVVTPFFEEPSIQQTLGVPAEVRVWQEDESPIALIAGALKEQGLANGTVGVEETVRWFASDGLARLAPGVKLVSANPVVRGCRMHKTPAEIALMQISTDVIIAAYRWTMPKIKEGMVPAEITAMMDAAQRALGASGHGGGLALIGEAAAYPHGSRAPQIVREGQVVLMDAGCDVDGYASDVSRTMCFGKPSDEIRRVWDTVAKGQQVALATAKIGTPCGAIDDAVRAYYEKQGFGPGYRLPGLSHRTGHGIGMDGHEPVNLVHGETTKLEAGMCFSNEPGLYLPGKFGVRLEDCFHMTPEGPKWFSVPPTSIDKPV